MSMVQVEYTKLFPTYKALIDILDELEIKTLMVDKDTGIVSIFYRDGSTLCPMEITRDE